jgi:hypothetical protein
LVEFFVRQKIRADLIEAEAPAHRLGDRGGVAGHQDQMKPERAQPGHRFARISAHNVGNEDETQQPSGWR